MRRNRTTIGDNPLDAVAPSAHTDASKGDATMTSATAVATVTPPEAEAEAAAEGRFARLKALKGKLQQCKSPELSIVVGDAPAQSTRLAYDSEGREGFRLGEAEFVAVARDIAGIALQPGAAKPGVQRLMLWGAVGALAAGPVGALVGCTLGGKRLRDVTARLELKDGRVLDATMQFSTLERIRKVVRDAQAV